MKKPKAKVDINRWELGLILKDARIRKKLSQKAVAAYMGYTNSFISMLEHGKQLFPLAAVPKLVQLYSQGDQTEDARLILSILYLSNKEQWKTLSPILALVMGKDHQTMCDNIKRTVKLRLQETGVVI